MNTTKTLLAAFAALMAVSSAARADFDNIDCSPEYRPIKLYGPNSVGRADFMRVRGGSAWCNWSAKGADAIGENPFGPGEVESFTATETETPDCPSEGGGESRAQ